MFRRTAFVILVPALLAATGCFALFPLDEFQEQPAIIDAGDGGEGGSTSGNVTSEGGADARARVIFVTEAKYTGALDGKPDDICAATAADAGIGGSFKAIIVTADNPAATRFIESEGADGGTRLPLVDTVGKPIADSYTQLFADGPSIAINHDQKKANIPGSVSSVNGTVNCTEETPMVWTGSNATGTTKENDCNGFGSTASKQTGVVGVAGLKAPWLQACTVACNTQAHLYCGQL